MAVVRVPNSTSFKPGHKGKGGIGARGQIRRDLTVELISQLNETLKDKNGVERTKLHRVVKNLIDQATIGADVAAAKARGVKLGGPKLPAINETQRAAALERTRAIAPVLAELAGMSAHAAARELNVRSVATPTGVAWSAKTVIRVRERLARL